MTTCPMCAEDVDEGVAVCPHCGHLLSAPASRQRTAPDAPLPARFGESVRAPTRVVRLRQYLVPLMLGGLLAVALAARFVLSRSPPAPDVLPHGAGWWCNEAFNMCTRTREECDPNDVGVINGAERMCERQEAAWCFTYVRTGEQRGRVECRAQERRCDEARAGHARSSECSRVSDCARVGDIQPSGARPAAPAAQVVGPAAPAPRGGQSGAARSTGQADSERLPVSDSPVLGPRTALVTIVEFGDFQCPYCVRSKETLVRLRARFRDDLRIVWKNNPLPMHADAQLAAEAAMEVYAQGGNAKFWRFHDLIFEHHEQLARADLERDAQILGLDMPRFRAALDAHAHRDTITRDQQLAGHLQATGTPTFFINGTQLTGAQPYEIFEQLVAAVLTHARTIEPPTNAYAAMVAAPLPSPDSTPRSPTPASQGTNQPSGEPPSQSDSPAAHCTYPTHTSFHLRATPTLDREGAEEIRSLPIVEVLGAGELRRRRDRIFNVRLLDGSHREGWMFIPTQELSADCPN